MTKISAYDDDETLSDNDRLVGTDNPSGRTKEFPLSSLTTYLSTKGIGGASAYDVAVLNGFVGTEEEWLDSLHGVDGKSAYELAVIDGFVGTEAEWLASLEATRPYNVYTALITQSGTSNPTVAVLENTTGQTITWAYSSTGLYIATSSGSIFTNLKTAFFATPSVYLGSTYPYNILFDRLSDTQVFIRTIKTDSTATDVNSVLTKTTIEIRVYP